MNLAWGFRKRHIVVTICVILYSFLLIHIVQAFTNGAAEPGTEGNPLVSQDYVDKKINDQAAKIVELTDKLNALAKGETVQIAPADTDGLNTQLVELNKKVTQLTRTLNTANTKIKFMEQYAKFSPVEVKAGQQLIGGEGTEIILRSGQAKAIAFKNASIADVTTGRDLQDGGALLYNHLLFISRDDGRGFNATTDVWVLVKGPYTIK